MITIFAVKYESESNKEGTRSVHYKYHEEFEEAWSDYNGRVSFDPPSSPFDVETVYLGFVTVEKITQLCKQPTRPQIITSRKP